MGEIKRGAAEVEGEVEEEPLLQSTMVSSGLFDDFEHATADLKRPVGSILPKEVSDDDEPLIVFEDVDQQNDEGEEEGFHGGVLLEGEPSDNAASPSSGSEHSDMHTSSALRQQSTASESFDGLSDEELPVVSVVKESERHIPEQHDIHETAEQETNVADAYASQISGSDSDLDPAPIPKRSCGTDRLEEAGDNEHALVAPPSKGVDQHISKQQDLHEKAIQETAPSDADVSHTSDSDVSDMELPAAIIRGPFLNLMDRKSTSEDRSTVSPEIVLRGLIRDVHPETFHFTLPHSSFSPNDLRKGLQYAYSALQAATSKLTMLEMLDNETTSMNGADLRRWIALADNSNPSAHAKPRLSVIFESLSIGEMRAALEELVQSRLVVEGEVEKTQMSLMRKAVAKERQEKTVMIPVKRVADFDKMGDGSSKKRRVSQEGDETVLDAFLTAIMVLLVGVLYLYICE